MQEHPYIIEKLEEYRKREAEFTLLKRISHSVRDVWVTKARRVKATRMTKKGNAYPDVLSVDDSAGEI